MKIIWAVMISLVFLATAEASKEAVGGRIDPRIKTVTYSERDVVIIHGHYGYSTHVVFADDEEIVHISPGDSLAWQIVPKQNHLFLKPMENDADTNLSLLTNKRQYNFELRAHNARSPSDPSLSFAVKFIYPEDELKKVIAAQKIIERKQDQEVIPGRRYTADMMNFEYSMQGSEDIAPTRVFDDGQFTYFQFPKEVDTPAIFLVNQDEQEAIINYHVRGKYVVVQRIGSQFVLRSGQSSTCIYNDTYQLRKTPSELNDVANVVDP